MNIAHISATLLLLMGVVSSGLAANAASIVDLRKVSSDISMSPQGQQFIKPPIKGNGSDIDWLFDPLGHVTELDIRIGPQDLARLVDNPRTYVPGRMTLRNESSPHGSLGPFEIKLRLKGYGAFRPLTEKAAFRVTFLDPEIRTLLNLKGLTLNNMVQDPSMISEALSSRAMRVAEVPSARVGYAYVTINDNEYGLYANVETIDDVMVARWFEGTTHIFEGEREADITSVPVALSVDEGPNDDLSDLSALKEVVSSDSPSWFRDMDSVTDIDLMLRAWAVEHYINHYDGYSVQIGGYQPNNYYLHSDSVGRFAMIPSGMDRTWETHVNFGSIGDGIMFRRCAESRSCRDAYIAVLRHLAPLLAAADIAGLAHSVRSHIDPWVKKDPRKEISMEQWQSATEVKTAVMEQRPSHLVEWLERPVFVDMYWSFIDWYWRLHPLYVN